MKADNQEPKQSATSQEEYERQLAEYNRQMEEYNRQMEEYNKQMGKNNQAMHEQAKDFPLLRHQLHLRLHQEKKEARQKSQGNDRSYMAVVEGRLISRVPVDTFAQIIISFNRMDTHA